MQPTEEFRMGAKLAELVFEFVKSIPNIPFPTSLTLGELQAAFAGDVREGALPMSTALENLRVNLEDVEKAHWLIPHLEELRRRMQQADLLDKGWFEDVDDPEPICGDFRGGYIYYIAMGGKLE